MTEPKYKCDKCHFECAFQSAWNKHIATELHITGKRKKKSNCKGPFKCNLCAYVTKNATTFRSHTLNEHSQKEERKENFKYYCDVCDFGTFSKDIMNTHHNNI